MISNKEAYMMAMLECGTSDLELLEDVNFDIGDIVVRLLDEGIKPTLGEVLYEAFSMAIDNIKDDLEQRIRETETELRSIDPRKRRRWNECSDRLQELKSLRPREDIHLYFNFLDTHVEFYDNEELYHRYLQDSLDEAENDFGWPF